MSDCIEDLLFVPAEEREDALFWAISDMNERILQLVPAPAEPLDPPGPTAVRGAWRSWWLAKTIKEAMGLLQRYQ